MSTPAAKPRRPTPPIAAAVCGAAALLMFLFFGNASRGWVNTPSLFWWWISQWLDPNADSEHGWLILGLSVWLLWRNLRIPDSGYRIPDTPIPDSGYRIPDFGFRIPDSGKRIPDTPGIGGPHVDQSEVRNPQAAISDVRDPQSEISSYPASGIRNPESGISAPLAALLAGLALHALGFAAQQARLSIIAFLVFTWGVLRLAGGRRWGAAAAFPLAFMMFSIPVNVLDSLGFWLRMGVVDTSAALAHAAGIGVVKSGTQLLAPDGRYHYDVAAACSGIRSLTAMVALSLLAGYLNFRHFGRRTLVLLLCLPLVYVGNVARIVAIIVAAQLGGPKWGDAAHEIMGFGVFVIVLGGVLLAIAAMRRWWPEREISDFGNRKPDTEDQSTPGRREPEIADFGSRISDSAEDKYENRSPKRSGSANPQSAIRNPQSTLSGIRNPESGIWLIAGMVIALCAGEILFLHHLATSPARGQVGVALAADGLNPIELPAFLGTEWIGRRAEITAVEREILPADTGFSRRIYVPVANPQRSVLLSIVLSGRDRTSIHRPELCLVGQGWTITEKGEHRFRRAGRNESFPATLLRVSRQVPSGRGMSTVPQLTAYWFIGGDDIVATHWRRVARDAWNRVVHARADRWAYVLMQTDASDGEPAALARMQAVLDATLQVFAPQKP